MIDGDAPRPPMWWKIWTASGARVSGKFLNAFASFVGRFGQDSFGQRLTVELGLSKGSLPAVTVTEQSFETTCSQIVEMLVSILFLTYCWFLQVSVTPLARVRTDSREAPSQETSVLQ